MRMEHGEKHMTEFGFGTKLVFGKDSLEYLRTIRKKKVFLVTDGFVYQSGLAKKVGEQLSDCEVSCFHGVAAEPGIAVVCAGVRSLLDADAEIMIAVGGGSALDAAKAIRGMAERIFGDRIHIAECIAVPTTSGTGSEVTDFAVISDPERQVKFPLHDARLRPTVALLDPSLVATVPQSVTADTGMDVLTHAIEAYVSTGANDFSDALAEKAAALVMKFLPMAYRDGTDLAVREKMHNASCMAGLAFNSAGLGLNHGIAHGLGAHLHLPHGRANAILLPHVIEYNANLPECGKGVFSAAAKKYRRLAELFGLPAGAEIVGVDQLCKAVIRLNRELGIPADLKAAGCQMKDTEKEQIAESALKDVTTTTNPRTPSRRDVLAILDRCRGGNGI
jgi:alcohol dehydrogenase class IV